MSTFAGIGAALSALTTNRRGLEVTGQNIANANTEGYSRQRLNTEPAGTMAPGRWARASNFEGGVNVTSIARLRDSYLESRGHVEHERQASATGRLEVLSEVQTVFNEPGGTGLQAKLGELWAGFADLADNPGDLGARTQLLTRAKDVATALNSGAGELSDQFSAQRAAMTDTTADINTKAARLADLNDAVRRARQSGGTGNELADQRDLLVMNLVEATGAKAVTAADGSVGLSLGGGWLVQGATARAVDPAGATTLSGQSANPVGLVWQDTGTAVSGVGGAMGATLSGLNNTLPDYAAELDKVASALTTSVNTVHTAAFTKAGVAGGAFFSGTTAAGISVAITNPADIAASGSATKALDGSAADKLSELANSATGADVAYRTAVSKIGIEANSAKTVLNTQTAVTDTIDSARASESGVNLDEELTAMLTYQRSYEAAAKVMSAIDSMLDTMINRMGA